MKHAKDGKNSSSEQTRQKLIEAGLLLFGDQGFDGVSTRALAQAAGVNQAAILYHFQSKEGLYLAVAEAIVASVQPGLKPLILDIQQRLSDGAVDAVQARTDIQSVVLGLLREILTRACEEKCGIGGFMLREQLHPSPAFDILYRELLEPLHSTLCQLVAKVRGAAAESADIIIEVQALLGQAIIFAAHRGTLLRRLHSTSLTPAHLHQISDVLAASLARQFA